MALRTKIRVAQVTGSFGTSTGQINDQIAGVATGSINSSDLSSVLSHLAASIKRIHGADSFTEGTAGIFRQSLTVTGSLTATTGLSGSLTKLADGTSYLIAGSNVTITSASNGAVTISSTGGSSTPAGSDTQVQFNDGGSAFGASANFVFNKSTNTMSVARLFVTGTGNSLTSSGSIRVLDGAQSPVISLSTAGVISGSSLTLGGNAAVNGGSLTTTATTFNLLNTDATTLNIGGAATTVGLGASTGTTTVNNNLVVKGDLFISGTTTTINSTITEFQDAIIGFGFASGSVAQAAGDRGFIGGIAGSNNVAFYWSNALSAFAAATTTSTPSAGSVTVAALQPILASQVQVGNSFNTLTRTGTRLILSGNVVEISGSTVNLTAAGTRVVTMDSTSFDPGATNTFDLGTSSLVWNNLYAKDITVTGRGKFTSEVTSSVSADTNYQISGLDWSAISAANRSKFIDVFVNGSLLLTGSDAGAGSRDYYLGTSNDGVKFTFGLTVDDVVAVVVR